MHITNNTFRSISDVILELRKYFYGLNEFKKEVSSDTQLLKIKTELTTQRSLNWLH